MSAIARLVVPLLLAAGVAAPVVAADRKETRAVSGFTAIGLSAPIKVVVVQGEAENLVLEGDERALAHLETVVEKGVLLIRSRAKLFAPGLGKVRAFVSARTIEALRISGSGDITVPALRTAELKVEISGSGDVRIGSLAASSLNVSVGGSGNVTVVEGKVDRFITNVAGSGDVKAAKFEAREAQVRIAGSGDVTLWAKESLAVSIAGSGDVRYYGDPAIKQSVVGAGSVRRAGASPS